MLLAKLLINVKIEDSIRFYFNKKSNLFKINKTEGILLLFC